MRHWVFLGGGLITLVGAALTIVSEAVGVPVLIIGSVLLLGGAARAAVVERRRLRDALARLDRDGAGDGARRHGTR